MDLQIKNGCIMGSVTYSPPAIDKSALSSLCKSSSEYSPHPILAIDRKEQLVIFANTAFVDLFGIGTSEVIDKPLSSIIACNEGGALDLVLKRVFQSNAKETLNEKLCHIGHSNKRYLSFSIWPVAVENNLAAGLMVQVTDATEAVTFRNKVTEINESLIVSAVKQHELVEIANKLNEQLQIANEAKNLFLAAMSHEIRTPLNAILGCAELMSQQELSIENKFEFESRIKRNSLILTRLIDDILDLSKIEAGKLEIARIETDLPELISDVEITTRKWAEDKSLSFSFEVLGALPQRILTDPSRLSQILTNVIGNAIKFTHKGSISVAINTSSDQQKICFLIKDTGLGMTGEEATKLFQPFTQLDASITRRFGGTGLGLDLARRLARALDGDIVLIDSKPELGSVFEITIALDKVKPSNALKNHESDKLPRLDGVKVLLAEDAPDNQFLIIRYLTKVGAKVDVAWDGEEAVSMARASAYDIVLMDIQMPKLDGYQATTQLRKQGYNSSIVALTAHAMNGELDRCRSAGCDGYLTKPVSMSNLVETIYSKIHENKNSQRILRKRRDNLH